MKLKCTKCQTVNDYSPDEVRYDYSVGYDVKYVQCPECGQVKILKYWLDENMDVNNDDRFYT